MHRIALMMAESAKGLKMLTMSQAATKLWPEVFESAAAHNRKAELVEKMRDVRPVVETG